MRRRTGMRFFCVTVVLKAEAKAEALRSKTNLDEEEAKSLLLGRLCHGGKSELRY